ncbi:MAG: preprotein translocase subunit SecA [Flavobacteriales bacterium Tduv]
MSFLNKILQSFLGKKNEIDLKEVRKYLEDVKKVSPYISSLSDDALRSKTLAFKARIAEANEKQLSEIEKFEEQSKQSNEIDTKEKAYAEIDRLKKKIYEDEQKILLEILPEAFAVVRETARRFAKHQKINVQATDFDRMLAEKKTYVTLDGEDKALWENHWDAAGKPITWDMVHYDVQLIGGAVLHQGKIAEMATGEGKTLVATLPIYLNALTGRGVHVVTVNDYLAKRDAAWMASIMEFHGLNVDCIDNYPPNTPMRRQAYKADITYGTNNEFGFDYLRDNMAHSPEELVQRELNYAIVDEVDSVLIDDARTPLIISGPVPQDNGHEFDALKPKIERIVQQQRIQLNKTLNEARDLIKSGNKKTGGFKLLQLHRGLPKYKPLIKFLSEENIRVTLQKTESEYLQDNQCEMPKVDADLYFVIDEKNNTIELTDKGIKFLSEDVNDPEFFILPDIAMEIAELENKNLPKEEEAVQKEELLRNFSIKSERLHTLNQLLKAYTLFEKNVEYVVLERQVKIVDEQTGRIMEGRRYSDGLHQALEAKENVKIEAGTQTFATITLQNYFRMYNKLAGMTGTAETEAGEFWQIYKLDVVVIPTHRPIQRKDQQDLVFKTIREKYNAIIEEIARLSQENKRPVLVGTTSVEVSELLSRMLKLRKIQHNVLNAKLYKKEADIVAEAGLSGIVTIATNMAGRGTDIKLSPEVQQSGGLAIIGTERHDSRRVDRQLRGRSGRQGDPGTSQFYVSLEDNLMRLFVGSDRLARLMDRFGHKEGDVIQHPLVTRSIERAQKKVEENNFGTRKRLLEYDDVMNKQRGVIYKRRRNALRGERLNIDISTMVYNTLKKTVQENKSTGDFKNFEYELIKHFALEYPIDQEKFSSMKEEELIDRLYHTALNRYEDRKKYIAAKAFPVIENIFINQSNQFERIQIPITDGIKSMSIISNLEKAHTSQGCSLTEDLEKATILAIIDERWKEHLREMDDLRHSVQNAVYEQKDPLLVYKREAFNVFQKIIDQINKETVSFLFRADLHETGTPQVDHAQKTKKEKIQLGREANASKKVASDHYDPSEITIPYQAEKKIGRNDRVSIRHITTGELKELKFKQAEEFLRNSEWMIEED